MREALLFNLKKSAAESHRMLVEVVVVPMATMLYRKQRERLVSPVQ